MYIFCFFEIRDFFELAAQRVTPSLPSSAASPPEPANSGRSAVRTESALRWPCGTLCLGPAQRRRSPATPLLWPSRTLFLRGLVAILVPVPVGRLFVDLVCVGARARSGARESLTRARESSTGARESSAGAREVIGRGCESSAGAVGAGRRQAPARASCMVSKVWPRRRMPA